MVPNSANAMPTLTTVLMVGIYRTHAALEAAWKYFILGSVGIAFALFGTILVYMAARPVVGEGQDGMVWTILIRHAASFDPALLNVAFIFLFRIRERFDSVDVSALDDYRGEHR